MNSTLTKMVNRVHPWTAFARCVGIMLAYLFGAYVTGRIHEGSALAGAMLACTSAIVVMQKQDVKYSFSTGWMRLLSTFIGTVIAILYLLMFRFTLVGMLIATFILQIICMFLNVPNNGKMATITLVVIMIVSKQSPDLSPVINGLLRFSEAAIGVVVGALNVLLVDRILKWKNKTVQNKHQNDSLSK